MYNISKDKLISFFKQNMALDLKYKIIIVVFAAVVLLYIGHYFVQQLNTNSSAKKETFIVDDDVEHYEEPPAQETQAVTLATLSEPKYDLRVLVLDDIEKLRILDKDLKGKLMQEIFNDLDSLKGMSTAERELYIKKKYDIMKISNAVAATTATTAEIATSAISAILPTKAETDSFEEPSRQLLTKTEEALVNLLKVQTGLQEIKTYANAMGNSTAQTAQTAQTIPVPNIPSVPPTPTPTFQMPQPSQAVAQPSAQTAQTPIGPSMLVPGQSISAAPAPSISALEKFVDGFENIVSYAPY
jgi:hypothetical protein